MNGPVREEPLPWPDPAVARPCCYQTLQGARRPSNRTLGARPVIRKPVHPPEPPSPPVKAMHRYRHPLKPMRQPDPSAVCPQTNDSQGW